MNTTAQPNPTAPTTNGSFTSFADMVNYSSTYAELERNGIRLTEDEKKKCEEICSERLRNHDGGQVIGNSFGGTIQGFAYTLLAFLKNLFSGHFSSLSDLASGLGNTVSTSAEQGKLYQLQLAESETYLRLKAEGGNLAAAAEYITGVKPSNDNSSGKILQASILNQVGKHINLPVDTNTSLNRPVDVAEAPPQAGLPPKTSTQPLTYRG